VELVQAVPWPEQDTPSEQIAPLHVSDPQHCELVEQAPPVFTQPLSPVHVPPEHVSVPQQSELLEHLVPWPWQEPPLQTLLLLQSKVPQQSPLVLQT
jgi:hypothetical protein